MDDELYEDENPMSYHDKMEQLWQETKESLKAEKEPEVEAQQDGMDNVVDGVRESSSPIDAPQENIESEIIESTEIESSSVEDSMEGKTGDLFAGTSESDSPPVEKVEETVENLADGIKDVGSDLIEGTKDAASNIVDKGSSMVSGTAIAAGAAVGGLFVGAKKLAENVTESASDLVDNTINTAKGIGEDGVETVNEAASSISEKASDLVNEGKKSINEMASSFVDNDIPAVLRPKDIFKEEEIEVNDERLEPAKEKIADILLELKEKNFNKDYGILGYLLSFPLILVSIWQFIQMGLTLRIGVLVLLAIFFVLYRGAVKGITKRVFDLKAKVQVGQMSPMKEIFAKVDYVVSGIELNLKRINYTKWLYIIFTPFLFYGLAEIWKGPFDAKSSFYMFVIAYAMSFLVWPFVFKQDYKKLEELDYDLNAIRREFL